MTLFISKAYAAADSVTPSIPSDSALADVPQQGGLMGMNLMMVAVLILLFYVLLIMPQQKRYKKHKEMVDTLKKGDKVLTAGGFIATVEKMDGDKGEVVLDLGGGTKVTALRSSIQNKMSEAA